MLIKQLTYKLIHQEWSARKTHRRRQLYTRLPVAKPVRLLGRDAAFVQAHRIFDQLDLNHMQVTGACGVGKTAFVQEFLRQQIEAEALDAIVCIDRPCSVAAVRDHLSGALLTHERRVTMREFVTMHRTAIVIDDAEHLQTELDDIKDLLDEPSEARVIVINRLHLPLSHVLASVHLSDLNQDDALKLIRMLADAQFRRNDEQISDDEIWYVWSAAGGNPGAIQNRVAEFAGGLYILK